jgi:hypothetical protein
MSSDSVLIPYEDYYFLFRESIPSFQWKMQVYSIVSYFLSLSALSLTTLTTVLHTQRGGSLVGFESETTSQVIGFFATLVTSFNVFFPTSRLYVDYKNKISVMVTFLKTRQPISSRTLFSIFDSEFVFLNSPTNGKFYVGMEQSLVSTLRSRGTVSQLEGNASRREKPPPEESGERGERRTIPFEKVKASILFSVRKYEWLSSYFSSLFYFLSFLQVLFTSLSSFFHEYNLFPGTNVAPVLGLVFGILGTLIHAVVGVIPVEEASSSCRTSTSICKEILIGKIDPDETTIAFLFSTNCLFFKNPILQSS